MTLTQYLDKSFFSSQEMAICNLQLNVLTTLQIIQHLEESMILFNGMTLTSRYCIFPLSQKIFLHVWCGKRPGMGFLLQMAICARQLKVFESHPESFRAFYSFRLNSEPPIKHIKIILKWWEDKYVRLLGLTSNYTVIQTYNWDMCTGFYSPSPPLSLCVSLKENPEG